MDSIRDVQLNILREIDSLCRKNGLPYILSEFTAYSAVETHDFYDETATPTIAMRARDAFRLKKLLRAEGFGTEDAFSNRRLSKFVMRCSDSGTFLFNAEEMGCFAQKGIGIDIELIRGVPRLSFVNRLLILFEDASVLFAKLEAGCSIWIKPLLILFGGLLRACLSLVYRSARLGRSGRLRICRFPYKSVEFGAELLDRQTSCSLRGCDFAVPEALDRYLTREIDYDWSRKRIKRGNPDFHLAVWDTERPFTEYAALDSGKVRINWIRWFLIKARIRKLRNKLEWYWEVLLCTGDRFRLARIFLPQKDEILRLYRQKDFPALHSVLQELIQATERHIQHGIGLCFDKDILEITLEILEADHGRAYAERVRKAVPPRFLTPPEIGMEEHD